MALRAYTVTVATTATLINGTDNSARFEDKLGLASSIVVSVPSGGATVYVGGLGVTTATGFPVAAGQSFATDLRSGDVLYGIVAAATQAINVFQTDV
jgi:hypothetical protein